MKATEVCKVILLKDKVSTDPSLNVENKNLANALFNNVGSDSLEGKNLYIISDEEIKEGDLVMDFYCSLSTTNPTIYKWSFEDGDWDESSSFEEMVIFKVVNSTDFTTRMVNVEFVEVWKRSNFLNNL